MTPSFDEVIVVEDGAEMVVEARAFIAWPLHQRIKHILAGTVRFRARGSEVPKDEALRSLMTTTRIASGSR